MNDELINYRTGLVKPEKFFITKDYNQDFKKILSYYN